MDVRQRQLKRLQKQEAKWIQKAAMQAKEREEKPGIQESIQQHIPQKVSAALESGFEAGFRLVFEKGTGIIEKTYDKKALLAQHQANDTLLREGASRKRLRTLNHPVKHSKLANTTFSTAEGILLGLLGIGIPDIPVFLGLLLKGIYEIALNYGYRYDSVQEKSYLLTVISGALSSDLEHSRQELETLGWKIDSGQDFQPDLQEKISYTAKCLSRSLLTSKFLQTIPLVGAAGGAMSGLLCRKVSTYAALQYQKRYLIKQLRLSRT